MNQQNQPQQGQYGGNTYQNRYKNQSQNAGQGWRGNQNSPWEICESCGGQHSTMECQLGQMTVEQAQYVNQQNQPQQG